MRHAQSEANSLDILASQQDYPLSRIGRDQAESIAAAFRSWMSSEHRDLEHIVTSPLLRAQQTAEPFERLFGLKAQREPLLIEQHLGRFSGMSYEAIDEEPDYQADRSKRWDWVPSGGGESYQLLYARVREFFEGFSGNETLIVTHAVTMRLIHTVLSDSAPEYPHWIAANGDIWEVDFTGIGKAHEILVHQLDSASSTASRA